MNEFDSLHLSPLLLKALKIEGYSTPTPIQERAIPLLLEGRDLLGIAQTGTGKTAAFALPILQLLLTRTQAAEPRAVRALVLAPTRELAVQISESFRSYARFTGARVGCVVGGVPLGPQINALSRGLDVLVATPGRLLDHLSNRHVRLDRAEFVVLDEADHMFDLGFIEPIRKILKRLPQSRQSLFFSATMPKEIESLANEFLRDPIEVKVTPPAATADRVAQQVVFVEGAGKRDILVELLGSPEFRRTIVFTRTKRGADRVARHLEESGIVSAAIHGNKSQGQRQRALNGFRSGQVKVLVATDIAARGIDVEDVSHVVNFELPDVPEVYVHRIGRTARAGAEGAAISLCCEEESGQLRAIERLTRQRLPVVDRRQTPADDRPRAARPVDGRGPRGGAPQRVRTGVGPNSNHGPRRSRRSRSNRPQVAKGGGAAS